MNGRLLVAFVGALAVALIRCGSDDCTSADDHPGQLRVEHLQLVVVERDDGCDDARRRAALQGAMHQPVQLLADQRRRSGVHGLSGQLQREVSESG